jgi:hypothetical protein
VKIIGILPGGESYSHDSDLVTVQMTAGKLARLIRASIGGDHTCSRDLINAKEHPEIDITPMLDELGLLRSLRYHLLKREEVDAQIASILHPATSPETQS